MNVVINSDATQLTIIDVGLSTSAIELTLDRKYGCNSTVLPVDVTGKISTIVNNSFTVSLSDLYPTNTPAKIEDGIHYFELQYSYFSGVGETTFVTDNFCLIVDYDLKCKLLKANRQDLFDKYQALFYNFDCDSCLCTTSCKIYNDILTELNIPTTNGNNDCGCN